MPLFSRKKKPASRRHTDSWTVGENILVISDIHLGEDVLVSGPEHLGEYIRALNRELAEFVEFHRVNAHGDRRWHLVINGDMFDFVKASVGNHEDSKSQVPSEIRPNTPEQTVYKLQHILEIHRPLFRSMAEFLLDGHTITIIEGNHDAEFYFEGVRNTLRDALVELARRSHSKHKDRRVFDAGDIARRLKFQNWFLASPGRFHIEHGHQYDEYCSFEYNLAPYDRQGADVLATPMSHRPMPYITEMLGDFSTHGVDEWRLRDFARFGMQLGPKLFLACLVTYAMVVRDLLRSAGPKRREQLKKLHQRHEERLLELSHHSPYSMGILREIDQSKALPAEYSWAKMAHMFFFDRALVLALTLTASVLSFLFLDGFWKVGGIGAACVLGYAISQWFHRLARPPIEPLLREAAARLCRLTGARYVVFGHSHHPEIVDLSAHFGTGQFGERAFYVNSGSWVTREVLRGEEGQGMTYVEMTAAGVCLRRWVGADKEPHTLDATAPPIPVGSAAA